MLSNIKHSLGKNRRDEKRMNKAREKERSMCFGKIFLLVLVVEI